MSSFISRLLIDEKTGKKLSLGQSILFGAGIATVGAIITAPFVMPAFNLAAPDLSEEASLMMHNEPSGLAGLVNMGLAAVPLIGASLASGGLITAVTSFLIGYQGMKLGHHLIEEGYVKLGNFIKVASLITSALISLPTLLTGLSTGLSYLGLSQVDGGFLTNKGANAITSLAYNTFGSIGGSAEYNLLGLGGVGTTAAHFATHAAPLTALGSLHNHHKTHHEEERSWAERVHSNRSKNFLERVFS